MSKLDERLNSGRSSLGVRIRSVRQDLEITMADAARSAGISYSYLSDVERGQLPSLEVLDRVAAALGTSVLSLVEGLYPWDGRAEPAPVTLPPVGRRRQSNQK